MDNQDILPIKDKDGQVRDAEVLLCFRLEEEGAKYIIYTFNEVDENDLLTLHVAEITNNKDGVIELDKIKDDDTWNRVKEVMRSVIKENQPTDDEEE